MDVNPFDVRNQQLAKLIEATGLNITLHNDYIDPMFILDNKYVLPIRTYGRTFVFFNENFKKENNKEGTKNVTINLVTNTTFSQEIIDSVVGSVCGSMERKPFYRIKYCGLFLTKLHRSKFNRNVDQAAFSKTEYLAMYESEFADSTIKKLESMGYDSLEIVPSY